MLPVIAIVGRPNVGKSTLFNCLTRSREALVADQPGMTRDRKYGMARVGDRPFLVVDTGGVGEEGDEFSRAIDRQTMAAVEEADLVLFLVDAKAGVTAADEAIAGRLRQLDKPVLLVVNKCDGQDPQLACAEFHALGMGTPLAISAAHNRGIHALGEALLARLPGPQAEEGEGLAGQEGIRLAILGRPNVGKSTLVNRLLGEERQITSDRAGTTRDSIAIPLHREGQRYLLIDTAGIRRRSRVPEGLEKLSVIKALRSIDAAEVVVLVLDAREGITDQDLRLLGHVLERGRALVIAVNKWDGLDREQREAVRRELQRRLVFVEFAEVVFISALHGTGIGELMDAVQRAWASARVELSTSRLNEILEALLRRQPPPMVKGRRVKLRYAHPGGSNPPTIVIHGNQVDALPASYRRYLSNGFRKALGGLPGTPLVIEFRTGENPFAGRRNPLTERQRKRRRRLMRHVKRR
ncbi:MAG: ribosome biogenesis GTPase Der [Gammaproteobacteria bacterium]|nr:MAG: ribosome biogenesis GTPase Der [Gammaproteobacteria bacterium]